VRPFQGPDVTPTLLAFERGDTGLFRELRTYF
jgi:hypothetical protein